MKFLVAIDGSNNSIRAADYALKMAQRCRNVQIHLVTIIYHFSSTRAGSDMEKARAVFKGKGIDVQTKILEGVPEDAIVKYATEQNMDTIVMGSRGRSALKGIVLGSVSIKVLNNTKIPVTIVK